MKILVVGSGGVGGAFARIASRRDFFETCVISDIDESRAAAVAEGIGDPRFTSARLDATKASDVAAVAKANGCDAILNAADPRFVPSIFDGALEAGATYLDMAMSLSERHPDSPWDKPGIILGQYQWDKAAEWEKRGQLALAGIGVEPGMSDVFARYAADHLFSEIDQIGVRDGANLQIAGYDFAPTFSIWTTIEECLNPPYVWEKERGLYTTEAFSEEEIFDFPEGIGELRCVNVEHEEVILIPRWVDCNRVTFKYGLDDTFIQVLKSLALTGLDNKNKIRVGGVEVSPRDVVAAALPDPATLGDKMTGITCAGTWVTGKGKDGKPREVYLYHVSDNEETMALDNSQAVVWQTAINPVIALELIAAGTWSGTGVVGPESFDAVPFLDLLNEYGAPWHLQERSPTS